MNPEENSPMHLPYDEAIALRRPLYFVIAFRAEERLLRGELNGEQQVVSFPSGAKHLVDWLRACCAGADSFSLVPSNLSILGEPSV